MMRLNERTKAVLLLVIGLTCLDMPGWTQSTYQYKAVVQKIDTSGVYKIKLKPYFVAKCNNKLSDIRLSDQNGKFTGYALSTNLFINNPDHFIEFPEFVIKNNSDTSETYIAENKDGMGIDRLWIKLKNADVDRTINLLGSDDLKKWYAIKENYPLEKPQSGNEPEFQQMLYFPTSQYQYFKIQVNGKNKTPVKITRAGIYVTRLDGPELDRIPVVKYSVKDTLNVSHVYIHFDEQYLVNALYLDVSAPSFYSRPLIIYDVLTGNEVYHGTIKGPGSEYVYLSVKSSQLRLDISNGDDIPLTMKKIDAFQQQRYIISYLEAGHNYSILTGDSASKEPDYDLSFIKHRVYSQLPVVNHLNVAKNPAYVVPKPGAKNNFSSLLWIAIISVLVFLGFLTWRMVKELNIKS